MKHASEYDKSCSLRKKARHCLPQLHQVCPIVGFNFFIGFYIEYIFLGNQFNYFQFLHIGRKNPTFSVNL